MAETGPVSLEPVLSEQRGQRELREQIWPSDIRPDGGAAYVARLRMGRPGDRQSNRSQCTLLEDGQPLPHPRARHADIRRQGGGRYSHWTASALYFSASDSSDPRNNGRKYELVSEQSFVQKTAKVKASHPWSTFAIPASRAARTEPLRVVLRNLDPHQAVTTRLARRGAPDLTSAASILASITNADMSDQQRAVAIWKFLVDWRYHDYPAEERGEMHDPVKLINVYGYGFCDDSAAAFCALAKQAGIRSRSYGLSGHVVAEAYYDQSWHMFDPDHEVIYRNDNGKIVSVAELEQNPELITRTERDPIGSPSQQMARLYTTRDDNRPFQAASSTAWTLRPVIFPGDRVLFDFTDRRRVHRRTHLDSPRPRYFANGTWSHLIPLHPKSGGDGADTFHIRWPYVILGARLAGIPQRESPSVGSPLRLSIAVSADGKSFQSVQPAVNDDQTVATLDAWIEQQPQAVYEYWLRIEHADSAIRKPIDRLALHTYFQFAPRSLFSVQPGDNELELFIESAGDRPLADWGGLDVEIAWNEILEGRPN